MDRRQMIAMASGLLVLLAASNVSAGPGRHQHDGFFLRLAWGLGFGSNKVVDENDVENQIRGPASMLSIGIGHTAAEDLAIHAEIFQGSLIDPESFQDGKSAGVAEGRYALTGMGAGLTYYFMPVNLYLSGSVGLTVLHAHIGPWSFESDVGLGVDFLLGKEWWVSDDWGIGIAGQFMYSHVPSRFDGAHASFAGGLLFTATYN